MSGIVIPERAETIKRLFAEGKTRKEISQITGYPTQVIYWHTRDKAQKKCASCQYRTTSGRGNCDFILHTGRRRGCPSTDCKEYVQGKALRHGKMPVMPRRQP